MEDSIFSKYTKRSSHLPTYETFHYINLSERACVKISYSENRVYQSIGEIGIYSEAKINKFNNVDHAHKRVLKLVKKFENLGFVKVNKEKHQLGYRILIDYEDDDDKLLHDVIECEIDMEIVKKSVGNFVSASGSELFYNIWNFEDTRKSANEAIVNVLKAYKINKFKVFVNNNIEIDENE